MAIPIKKGEVFSPAPIGKADLLIIGDSIQRSAAAAEAFIEDSNRSIQLVGKEAQD